MRDAHGFIFTSFRQSIVTPQPEPLIILLHAKMNNFDPAILNFNLQEHSDGRHIACASIALDSSGQDLMNRISNRTYEQCRAGKLVLPSFPDFAPHIAALKDEKGFEQNKTYRVTCQVHDKLLVLDSLARKWLEDEGTCEEAKKMVKAHNDEYNPDGNLMTDRSVLCQKIWS